MAEAGGGDKVALEPGWQAGPGEGKARKPIQGRLWLPAGSPAMPIRINVVVFPLR